MHSLLGYRFDQLIHEQISGWATQAAPYKLLSVRLMVKDLQKEKDFFTHLLDITPLAETRNYIVLPISRGITLTLVPMQKRSGGIKTLLFSKINRVELDIETKNIQDVWQNARSSDCGQPSEILTDGNMLMFNIVSPVGLILRLWQRSVKE